MSQLCLILAKLDDGETLMLNKDGSNQSRETPFLLFSPVHTTMSSLPGAQMTRLCRVRGYRGFSHVGQGGVC